MKHALLIISLLLCTTPAFAQTGTCDQAVAEAYLDVNNVRARVLNNGGLVWRGSPHIYEVPQYGGKNSIFAAGLWIGGKVDGELRTTASTYGPWEFWPGPLDDAGNPPADCKPYDKIYSIYQTDIDEFEKAGAATEDLINWPWQLGAPVVDGDGDPNNYNLAGGDRPEIHGHQTLWWIMNDRGNIHERTATEPIGLEVKVTAFAAASTEAHINNATLYRYNIKYKGEAPLEEAFFSFYYDVDLGNFDDDYTGSDSTLSMGYVYNADNDDEGGEGYGSAPPAIGFDLLQGPLADNDSLDNDKDTDIDEPGERMPATIIYTNFKAGVQGDPDTAAHFYNYLTGYWLDGQRMTRGESGRGFSNIPTNYIFPGDPVTGEGWSELNPAIDGSQPPLISADRRGGVNTGPITLQPGDEQEIVLGILWARGEDNLDSVTQLKEASRVVQEAFDGGFDILLPELEALPTIKLLSPDSTVTQQPSDPYLQWKPLTFPTNFELQWSADPEYTNPESTTISNTPNFRLSDLKPFTTYHWRVRAVDKGRQGPWSESWSFSTSDLTIGNQLTYIEGFMTTSNAAGPIDPPDMAAFAFDDSGFPILEGNLTPVDSYPDPERPTSGVQQSTNASVWGIHIADHTRKSYDDFAGISLYTALSYRDDDYEWRFTEQCLNAINGIISEDDCLAIRNFEKGVFAEVPFALWNVGNVADTTDDYRMIPVLYGYDNSGNDVTGVFDIGSDHASSAGDDDPYTDTVYWLNPVDSLVMPGESGYRYVFFEQGDTGYTIFNEMALVQLDGGTAAPYDVALPEPGTTFRIVTAQTQPPILSAPTNNNIRDQRATFLSWNAPPRIDYQLQIDTNPEFSSPILNLKGLTEPYYKTGDFPVGTTYYWRVRLFSSYVSVTERNAIKSDWSETWSFTIPQNVATEDESGLATEFSLAQSYPNPFSTSTLINYTLPEAAPVKLEVFDTLGRRIQVLVDKHQPAGRHQTTFDAADLPNGLYFYRLTAGDFHSTKTMTLIR